MRGVLHLLAADIRHHRRWLLNWAVGAAWELVFTLGGWDRLFVDVGTLPVLDMLRMIGNSATMMLGLLVVVSSIQADSTIPTTRFWLTRPVSRGTLLASKLALALLLAAAGACVQAVAVALLHASPATVALACADALFVRLFVYSAVAALASVTPDAGKFLLGLIGGLIGLPLVVNLLVAFWPPGARSAGPDTSIDSAVVGFIVSIALSVAVASHQTLTRRLWRSAALACLAGPVALTVALTWHSHVWTLADAPTTPSATALPGVALSLAPDRIGVQPGKTDVLLRVEEAIDAAGLPQGAVADILRLGLSWRSAAGTVFESRSLPAVPGRPIGWDRLEHDTRLSTAAIHGLGAARVNEESHTRRPPVTITLLDRSDRNRGTWPERMAGGGTLRAAADLLVARAARVARLPIERGSEAAFDATRVGLLEAITSPERMVVTVRVARPRPIFTAPSARLPLVALVNEARHEAVIDDGPRPMRFDVPLFGVESIRVRSQFDLRRTDGGLLDAAWLAGAELCVFEVTSEVIAREVTVPDVRLEEGDGGGWRITAGGRSLPPTIRAPHSLPATMESPRSLPPTAESPRSLPATPESPRSLPARPESPREQPPNPVARGFSPAAAPVAGGSAPKR